MRLYGTLLQLLFPPKCILCGRLLKEHERDLCENCRTDSPKNMVSLYSLIS